MTLPWKGLLCFVASVSLVAARPANPEGAGPAVGQPAPAFTLTDDQGKPRQLVEFKGRRVALYFFCGCSWCLDVAKEWAVLQRAGALAEKGTANGRPATLVVYSGLDAAAARQLAAAAGLDRTQTTLLPDPEETVAEPIYHAEPCPRVFVLDERGILRYTNNAEVDAPRKAPAAAIVARALDALRAAAPGAPASP
jgi:peroxiredoxin